MVKTVLFRPKVHHLTIYYMKKIILLFTLTLAVCWGNQAYSASSIVSDCALPGPAVIKSLMQNTTSFSLDWTAVPGAVLYQIEVFEDATGNPVTTFLSDTTYALVTGLQPGTAYRVLISATSCADDPEFGDPEEIVVSTSIIIVDILIQYDCPPSSTKMPWQGGKVQFVLPVDGSVSNRVKVFSTQTSPTSSYEFYLTAFGINLYISPVDSSNWRGRVQNPLFLVQNVSNGSDIFNVSILSATATEMTVTIQALQSNLNVLASRCGLRPPGRDAAETTVQSPETAPYPNPFSDHLTILQPLVPNRKAADLTVFNALGKAVYRTRLQADETRISTADWPDGVYYVQVKNGVEITTYKAVK
jgi:hypothetical protein